MLRSNFEQTKNGGKYSRSGLLPTRKGLIKTPFFMPVATLGAVKGVAPDQVASTGAPVLLANTYHLHRQPGERQVKKLGGLHVFSNWAGPILTDSGGFQVFSLAKIRKITEAGVVFKDPKNGDEVLISPESSMQIQIALGADIIMAFDDLTGLDPAKASVREAEAVDRTHRWLVRCIAEFNKLIKAQPVAKKPLLFGIVQGGLNKDLRRKSLEFVQSQSVNGVAIGGLSVGESRKDMYAMLDYLAPIYDPNRARYLMGVGHPTDMRHAISGGIDMFDCVLPTRNARHGSAWITGDKALNLKNAAFASDKKTLDPVCDCATCVGGYSRAFLHQLFRTNNSLGGNLLSIHNLRYVQRICQEYQ